MVYRLGQKPCRDCRHQHEGSAMSEPSPTRTLAEEGARASRAINDTIKRLTAAGGANPLMDGFPNYLQAAQEYNAKMLEYTVANTMAMFEYVRKLSETKTTPELVELTTSHARTQFETLTAQAKELQTIAQKAMPKLGGMS
jgi:hypothetical protein